MVQQLVTNHINELRALDCLQLVSASIQDAVLNERQHLRESLGFVGVIFPVEPFFVGAKYLGEANGITAEIVDKHVVRFALLADGSVVVFGAAQDIDVALSFKEMVVVSAFEAAPAVTVSLDTLPDV